MIAREEAQKYFEELQEIYGDSAVLHAAGSLRRGKDVMKDIDIVPEVLDKDRFSTLSSLIFGSKATRGSYKGARVEFYTPPAGTSVEFVQWLWTGDKRYRVSLHARAKAIGKRDFQESWKLNNRGLQSSQRGLLSADVAEVARLLHTPLLPPWEMIGSSRSLTDEESEEEER